MDDVALHVDKNRSAMWRIESIRIAACLLLGLLTSVLVAWGLAAWLPIVHGKAYHEKIPIEIPHDIREPTFIPAWGIAWAGAEAEERLMREERASFEAADNHEASDDGYIGFSMPRVPDLIDRPYCWSLHVTGLVRTGAARRELIVFSERGIATQATMGGPPEITRYTNTVCGDVATVSDLMTWSFANAPGQTVHLARDMRLWRWGTGIKLPRAAVIGERYPEFKDYCDLLFHPSLQEDARGWPFLCLWSAIAQHDDSQRALLNGRPKVVGGIALPTVVHGQQPGMPHYNPHRASGSTCGIYMGGMIITGDLAVYSGMGTIYERNQRWANSTFPVYEARALPLRPIWSGLIANTLFYAAIWWSATGGLFWVRGLWRKQRGRCCVCGYNTTGITAAPCPECGTRIGAFRAQKKTTR